MKSLTHFNPYKFEGSVTDAITDFTKRLQISKTVLDTLREHGEMSGRELDNLVEKGFLMKGYSIRPFLDAFVDNGIRTEVRKEECIKVKMKHYEWGKLYQTHEDNMFIFVPIHNNPPYLIFHPTIESKDRDMVYLRGERIVQVERKYYILEE